MIDQIIVSSLAALVWLPPTLVLVLWMRWDYDRRIGRPARVSCAVSAAQELNSILEQIEDEQPALREMELWNWSRKLGRELQDAAFWEPVARMSSLRFFWMTFKQTLQARRHSTTSFESEGEFKELVSEDSTLDLIRKLVPAARPHWEDIQRCLFVFAKANPNFGRRYKLVLMTLRWGLPDVGESIGSVLAIVAKLGSVVRFQPGGLPLASIHTSNSRP